MNEPEPQSAVSSTQLVVLLGQWETEANMLRSGEHPRRQMMPRRCVLLEECAYRSCIADIKRLMQHNHQSANTCSHIKTEP